MGAKKPLALQKGHLTKKEKQEKELEEQHKTAFNSDYLNNMPDWLVDDVARAEWKRLLKEMQGNSMICNLDYNNLGAYCNVFSKWTTISKELGLNFKAGRQANPLVALELKYSDEMKKYAVLLGLSYEAKLKAMQLKTEKQESDIKDEFGEI
ncbi:P27 family phage terminase small subunit [Fusobacterium varium]|uniref:P27 family phage terminase small subunit n=1 Tax=Fusobacterium varium TaxID=856 RepID=UPI0022DF235C|nr:P27 family phage terminase small subunit [Fusobacterium varium]